ncbi:MAG TPA: sortase [Verrucomicrobiae bacterium]|nr:sortase [Verrucomicrobiae bacterium]
MSDDFQALPAIDSETPTDPAVELIRAKVARAFQDEPDAREELAETRNGQSLSKHQQFMLQLSQSDKSLAEIQTEWHHYYTQLPESEKHEVWQEFYDASQHTPYQKLFQKQQAALSRKREEPTQSPIPQPAVTSRGIVVADHLPPEPLRRPVKLSNKADTRQLKHAIINRVSAGGRLTWRHHLQSLMFGLATGTIVLVIFLFTFFNDIIIAPFIQPSRNVSSTPIILTGDSSASADTPPNVTIPKINVQIPIDFSLDTYDENVIENDLDNGVIHYPNTVLPGQNGNAAYFGHSSGNIFNNGKYKFAFTLLHDLTTGDLFYITYDDKTYAYRVFAREVVPPTDVGVINDTQGKQATAELITCDPPGISTNRLVVWGEQISPAVSTNTAGTPTVAGTPTTIAGNGPSLWSQLISTLEFWK